MRFASLIENHRVPFGRGVSDSFSPQSHNDGSDVGWSPSPVSSPWCARLGNLSLALRSHPALRIDAQSLPQGCRCLVYAWPVRLSPDVKSGNYWSDLWVVKVLANLASCTLPLKRATFQLNESHSEAAIWVNLVLMNYSNVIRTILW